MTRRHDSLAAAMLGESYEQLRDGAGGDAGLAWQQADREDDGLRTLYLAAIADGAGERLWRMRFEVDDHLVRNHERQVWAGEDGGAYDGAPLRSLAQLRGRGRGDT